jgi:hypothetical protein
VAHDVTVDDPNAHSKMIAAAARETLRPLGVRQKGRSRTWLDDQGTWVTVVEFQPSSWSRGTYLNVGVNWTWNPKPYYSFDLGHRVHFDGLGEYFEFESEEQFRPIATMVAERAAQECKRFRELLGSPQRIAETLEGRPDARSNRWNAVSVGIALGVIGEVERAQAAFASFASLLTPPSASDPEWEHQIYERTTALADLVQDTERFREQIASDVVLGRELLKLPATGVDLSRRLTTDGVESTG